MKVGEENLKRFFSQTLPLLDQWERRLMAAAVVEMVGRGGQALVSRVTEMSRNTLIVGAEELAEGATLLAYSTKSLARCGMMGRGRLARRPHGLHDFEYSYVHLTSRAHEGQSRSSVTAALLARDVVGGGGRMRRRLGEVCRRRAGR